MDRRRLHLPHGPVVPRQVVQGVGLLPARKVDADKRAHYAPHAGPLDAKVIILSLETGGALGEDWRTLDKLVRKESAVEEEDLDKSFRTLLSDVSCAIQKGVARMIYRSTTAQLRLPVV